MENHNTSLPNDCQGSCKTPMGCSCGKINHDALESMGMDTNKSLTKSNGSNSGGDRCSNCTCPNKGNCCNGSHKLEVYDWLQDMPEIIGESQMVEVQFKNTRKGYFLNSNEIEIYKGDLVAVEATPGHDIGEVTLTGKLVQLQMLKNNYRGETKRIYRIAKPNDIEKWNEARAKEHKTMLRAREIAEELQLGMKISDVEYQGDGNKAIFYYIADDRVDFRQLIKLYASEFRVKIEMKQIGARQEAGRVGGIGPCGRELCCASNMSNFISVSTSAARLQDIPLNPQKLAGQCGKLKCCLNFEVDTYVEAQRKLPPRAVVLETKDASFYHFKTDILSGTMIYSTDKHFAANLVTLPKERVFEVIRLNKQGERPTYLSQEKEEQTEKPTSHDILQENINRFDGNSKKKKFVKNGKPENKGGQNGNNRPNNRPDNKKPDNSRSENNRPENNKQLTKQPALAAKPEGNNGTPENKNQPKQNNKNQRSRNDRNRHNRNGKPDQTKPEE